MAKLKRATHMIIRAIRFFMPGKYIHRDKYKPELHYFRGKPGPRWIAKYGDLLSHK